MSSLSSINYTDINESCYSEDVKNLTKVNDTSPHLRISAKCELIQDKCFYQLLSLISFSFEDNPNLTIIGKESFRYCRNLTIINLSSCSKLKIISDYAFATCEKVTELLLPKGLLEIRSEAFRDLYLLIRVSIPASVKKLNAFDYCSKLEKVDFDEGLNLTSLERYVFAYTSITSFQIPEKVTKINGCAFSAKIMNITIHPNNNHLIVENNAILSLNKSILFFICNKTSESYEIPSTVITLEENCFYESQFKAVSFPSSIIKIEQWCFRSSKIVSFTIPENVKIISGI